MGLSGSRHLGKLIKRVLNWDKWKDNDRVKNRDVVLELAEQLEEDG
jgi:hypothetical protein